MKEEVDREKKFQKYKKVSKIKRLKGYASMIRGHYTYSIQDGAFDNY